MDTFLPYFLKVNMALVVLYIVYRLLFQQDTFFRLRRFTLYLIYAIAFLYPLPDLSPWLSTQTGMTEVVAYYSTFVVSEPVSTATNDVAAVSWTAIATTWFVWIYMAGMILLFLRCLIELGVITYTRLCCQRRCLNGHTYYSLNKQEEPYSFFSWIFLYPDSCPDETSMEEVLIHESAHAREQHSMDVLLGEVVCVLCWINPFAWLLKQEISINHEYIADQEVLYAGYDKKTYQYHLIGMEHPHKAAASLHNYFSVLPLKKRITMLNKSRTHVSRRVKYLTLLPLAVGLLLINNMDAMARMMLKQVQAIVPVSLIESAPEAVIDEPVVVDEPTVVVEKPVVKKVVPQQNDRIYQFEEVEVEEKPSFPGGETALLKYLAQNIKYPIEAQEKGIQGRSIIQFVVEKNGSLSQITVLDGIEESLDKESVRVISAMPKWTPGKYKGNPIRVYFKLPVIYRLQ